MPECAQCGHSSPEAFAFCPTCGTRNHAGAGGSGLIGRTLNGKYRVLSAIGEGSMGTVYLGEHVALHKKVALKVLHDTLLVRDEALQRFQREGIAAGRVDHPNAIQIFDFDRTEDGLHFLAMEHVRGENLRERLARLGSCPPEEAVDLLRQLAAALADAHQHGIVHRDLKPENLMVVETPDGALQLKVLDFGLSRLVDRQQDSSLMTVPGRVMGTPLYMAPEQWRGEEADARSDLYSACLILWELVAGRHPFKGSNMTETFVKSTTEPPPSLLESTPQRALPLGLDDLLHRGLAKDRDERFQTAQELIDALDDVDFARTQKVRGGASGKRAAAAPAAAAAGAAAGRRGRGAGTARGRGRAGRGAGRAVAAGERPRWLWPAVGVGVLAIAAVVVFAFSGGKGGDDAGAAAPLVRNRPVAARSEADRAYLALLDEAREHWRGGDLAAARVAADKAVRHPSADAESYAVRAEAYLRQRDYDTALADYRAALQRLPGYAVAEAGLGWVALQRGDDAAAAAHFDEAAAADANCADAQAGRGAVLVRRGDFAAARAVLDPVAERAPEAARVHLFCGQARLGAGDVDAAVQSFVQAKREDPSLTEAWEGLGDAYVQKNDLDAAEQQYREALQSRGELRVRKKLAELLLAAGRSEPAAQVLQPALDAGQQDASLQVLNGLVAHARGDRAAAIAALERALALGAPAPAQVHLLLGTLLFEAERWGDAARQLEFAADADDSLAAAYRTWGLALFRMGEYSAAAFRLETAQRLEPKDLLTSYTLGVLYMDYLSQPDDAIAEFRAYRDAGGKDPKVDEWLRRLER